jgi:hypothetical protein
VDVRGWRDIGYHGGIEWDSGRYRIRTGRKLTEDGAHCPGMNQVAAGFCFVGNFMQDAPPLPMIDYACRNWIIPVMRAFGMITEDIYFHREKRQTACPGDGFQKGMLLNAISHFEARI